MSEERLDAISQALARLVQRQERIESRLDQIENALGKRVNADGEPGTISALPAGAEQPAEAAPIAPITSSKPIANAPLPVPPPLPDYAATPSYAAAPASEPIATHADVERPPLETRLGLNWLNRVAVVTLVIGVAFFFKYAIDSQWIGPGMRVALGIAGAMASLSLGEWMSLRGQQIFARGMTGLGLGLLYLSFYASYGFYDLLSLTGAFLLMAATTVAAGALAFHYDSRAVALLGLIGGFLTPALLSTGQDRSGTITAYTLLLSLGALVLGRIRRWPALGYLALAGTYLLYSGWSSRWLADSTRPAAFTWLTLAFALFFTFARNSGLWLLPLNAALYFAASYFALNDEYHRFMGAFTAALGILHAAYARAVSEKNLRQIALAVAVALLTLAAPIQFTGFRVTIVWAVEAATCAWLARKFDSSRLEFGAGILLTLVAFRLLARDSAIRPDEFWNTRLLTFALAAASFWIASQYLRVKEAKAVTYCAGHLILLWGLCLEIAGWAERNVSDVSSATTTGISILLTVYAIGLIVSGTAAGAASRSAINRLLGLALIAIVILKLYLVDVWQLSRGFRIVAFLGLGAMLLLVSYLYSRFKPTIEKLWKDPAPDAAPPIEAIHDSESGTL